MVKVSFFSCKLVLLSLGWLSYSCDPEFSQWRRPAISSIFVSTALNTEENWSSPTRRIWELQNLRLRKKMDPAHNSLKDDSAFVLLKSQNLVFALVSCKFEQRYKGAAVAVSLSEQTTLPRFNLCWEHDDDDINWRKYIMTLSWYQIKTIKNINHPFDYLPSPFNKWRK